MSTKTSRILNLDLFRASSIILIIFYHLTQKFYLPEEFPPLAYKWVEYSVEIFFVLSGFLVGSIFYKDSSNERRLFQFWTKRFLRTYPPYVCALVLAFLPVAYVRGEQFDWRYLVFLQNFYTEIPYFLVSWTLCVEEHFYLLFTLLMLFFVRVLKNSKGQLFCWLMLCIIPALFRAIVGVPETEAFGFYKTATVFRFDGIAMGCTAAFLIHRLKLDLSAVGRYTYLWIALLGGVWMLNYLGRQEPVVHSLGYSLLCLLTAVVMLSLYFRPPFWLSKTIFIKKMALMAYSLYLTHALVIHIGHKALPAIGNRMLTVVLTYVGIYVAGYLFYMLVEKPSLKLRDWLTGPSRSSVVLMAKPFVRRFSRAAIKR